MKRRFNYTKRQRIPRNQVAIAWNEPEKASDPLIFNGGLDLTLDPALPANAEIYLEAYSGPLTMRFHCGTVAHPSLPDDRALTNFAPGQRPLFRVKVTAPDDPLKRILARADSISPMSPEDAKAGRISILPVERVNLGDELWRVDMEELDQPKLQINSTVTEPRDISSMANEGDFLALAYPAVTRQILTVLLHPDSTVSSDHAWLVFGSRMAGTPAPDEDEYSEDDNEAYLKDCREWIDLAAAGFASHFETKRAFITHKTQTHDHA